MTTPAGILKPCYIFAPKTLARRIGIAVSRDQPALTTVRLPWGSRLEVNANEGIGREIFRQNVFDIGVSETAWRLLSPGETAVDVGANIGYMTSLFAHRVGQSGRVESFEPHPRIFARLEANVALNQPASANIRLHNVALGSREEVTHLVEPDIFGLNEGASMIVADAQIDSLQGSGKKFEVKVLRLDAALAVSKIGLLKIDVEGFEGKVLAGADQLLSTRSIQNIIYEAHDCADSPLHELLKGYGYTVFGIGHTLFGPKLSAGVATPSVDRSWESPSYLACLDAPRTTALLRPGGWHVLRGPLAARKAV
jgi:FkbM family methyltransferase